MKIKTIKTIIESKMNDWLATITDEKLREKVKSNLLVSGGSIASLLSNEQVNDYDVYIQDISVLKELAEYYSKEISSITILDGRIKQKLVNELNEKYKELSDENGIDMNNQYAISLRNLKEDQIKLFLGQAGLRVNEEITHEESLKYVPLFFSPNAISLSNDVQIVLRFWGTPEQIHKTFDFIHATNYFTFKDGLVRNIDAIESILTKTLKYQGSHYPLTSIIRAKKFVKRGYNIGAGELLKIMFQISDFDLTNPDVLEEQLIGVDVAYFDLIITALRNKQDSDPNFKLSSAYFNTLIDKVFND
jgi:hypothetical protein